MQCEMCGRSETLFKTKLEGSELELCKTCSSFGSIVTEPTQNWVKKKLPRMFKESSEEIVHDYGRLIRQAREKSGLNQEEFAKKISERTSILQKMENNQFQPSLKLAKKLQRSLKIRLVVESEETEERTQKVSTKSEGFTLGDYIKKKRKS